MNRKKTLLPIAVIAIVLSIVGFIADLNERVDNVAINIMEIFSMAFILFFILNVMVFIVRFIIRRLREISF